MSDTEYTLGLKENVTKGLVKIIEQAKKLKARFDKMGVENLKNLAEKAEKGAKSLNMLTTAGKAAGTAIGAGLATIAAKAFEAYKALTLADTATSKYQKQSMQMAGSLGPRFAYMTKEANVWAMQMSEKLGVPFETLAQKFGEGLHLGLNKADAQTYAVLDQTLGSLGTTGENLKQHFKDIQSLRPGQSVATLLQGKSQKEIQQMVEDFAALGVNMNDIVNMKADAKGGLS